VEKKVDKVVDGTASVPATSPIQSAIIVNAKAIALPMMGSGGAF